MDGEPLDAPEVIAATAEEKDLAWMPATNDVNEGALGLFCVL